MATCTSWPQACIFPFTLLLCSHSTNSCETEIEIMFGNIFRRNREVQAHCGTVVLIITFLSYLSSPSLHYPSIFSHIVNFLNSPTTSMFLNQRGTIFLDINNLSHIIFFIACFLSYSIANLGVVCQ